MIKKILFAALPALSMIGCLNDSSDGSQAKESGPSSPAAPLELSALKTPVKIAVGSKSVTLYKSPDGLEVVESVQPRGERPLLTPEMSGKTWGEIAELLAPGTAVAPEYVNEIYRGENGEQVPVEMQSADGRIGQTGFETAGLPKTSADASWFQQNYCSSGNAFSWCLLNRGGIGNEWGQTNCKMSFAYIILNFGAGIQFAIKVDGKRTLTTTIVNDNLVHGFTTKSSKDWLGLYNKDLHRYDITSSSSNGWHWAVNAHTW